MVGQAKAHLVRRSPPSGEGGCAVPAQKSAGTLRFARPALPSYIHASGKRKRAAANGHRPLLKPSLVT
jgi:hypothetical protein